MTWTLNALQEIVIFVFKSDQNREPINHMLSDRTISVVHIYPRKVSACVHQKACIGMLMAALFIIAVTGNNSSVINREMDKQLVAYLLNKIISMVKGNEHTRNNKDESHRRNDY